MPKGVKQNLNGVTRRIYFDCEIVKLEIGN